MPLSIMGAFTITCFAAWLSLSCFAQLPFWDIAFHHIQNPPHAMAIWWNTARASVTHWLTRALRTKIVVARPAKNSWSIPDAPKAILMDVGFWNVRKRRDLSILARIVLSFLLIGCNRYCCQNAAASVVRMLPTLIDKTVADERWDEMN